METVLSVPQSRQLVQTLSDLMQRSIYALPKDSSGKQSLIAILLDLHNTHLSFAR